MSKKKEAQSRNKKGIQAKNTQKLIQKPVSSLQKAKNILAVVQDKLIHDLDSQSISIPSRSVPYIKNQQQYINHLQKQEHTRLQKVLQQKQQVVKKLQHIENSEKFLHAGLNILKMRDKSLTTIRPKSELSVDDIQKLKKLKRQHKRFQTQLQQKTRKFQQREKQYKSLQKQLIQKRKKEENQKKKLQIQKRLQQLSEKQNQRAQRFQQQKRNITKLKYQKKLHQQLAIKWEKMQKLNEEKKRKLYQQRRKQNSVDLSQIKEHQKKYEDIIQKNRQQIMKKRMQTSKISRKIFQNQLHQSRFYTLVIQQDEKKKSSVNQRKQIVMNLVSRRKQFSQSVKQNYAPKLVIKSSQSQQKSQQKKKIPLQFEQMRKKGLSYLQQSKTKANRNAFTEKHTQMSIASLLHEQKPKYKDYLTENRQKQITGGKTITLQRDYNIEVQEAKNIMKKTNFSDQQKLQRVKLLAQRMQTYDPKTTKSSVLLQKIQAKMQILQTIQ